MYGNLKTAIASSGSLSSTRSINDYNTYGHKIQMVDQDKGSWTYTYNGFGELLTQTDAKAQVTSFMYDSAGRLIRRYDPSGTTCWEFGTSAASYNKGLLYRVSSYSGSVDCSTTATPLYRETYTYNSRGFVSNKLVHTAGHSFSLSTTYDSAGRPDTFNYPSWSLNPSTDDVVVKYGYQNGHMKQLSNAKNTTEVYQQITAVTARGQVAQLSFRNGMQESRTYDAATGWLDTLTLSRNNLTQQFMDYDYDTVGNVTHRKHHFGLGSNAGFSEVFDYDDLHRVTSRSIGNYNNSSGYAALPAGFKLPETYTYDVWGNIKSKTGIGHYCYDTSKTNRLTAVWSGASCTGTQQYTLGYDNNGNVSNDGKHTFTYTAFDKPSRISKGSNYTDFAYGPDRQLYRRTDVRNSQTTDSFYIDGLYERVTLPSGVIEHKFYVGNAVITKRSNNAHDELYLHKDNQGSTISISNSAGTVLQQFIYDPWGRQYSVSTNSLFSTYSNPGTSKGYTGHNMVNDFEVIHMGGRTYNPHLGRFMQADPFVQAPANLQNYNRYSYVLNNPMSYTDPSGYFFKKLGKFIKQYWRPIVAAIATVVTYGAASGWVSTWGATWGTAATASSAATLTWAGGAAAGAMAGFVGGAVATGSLRGAMKGAFSGAVFGGIGSAGWGVETTLGAHAVAGGVLSDLQGGNFGHGFWTAGIMKVAGMFNSPALGANMSEIAGRATIQAMVGGTLSRATGGKFANGAISAAIQYVVNAASEEIVKRLDRAAKQIAEDANSRRAELNKWRKSENWDAVRERYPELVGVHNMDMSIITHQMADDLRSIHLRYLSGEISGTFVEAAEMGWDIGSNAVKGPVGWGRIFMIASMRPPEAPEPKFRFVVNPRNGYTEVIPVKGK